MDSMTTTTLSPARKPARNAAFTLTEIIIGAEQWPECLNPITECANSSWYVWTTAFQVLPGAFDTTSDGDYEITDLLTEEPVVEVAE